MQVIFQSPAFDRVSSELAEIFVLESNEFVPIRDYQSVHVVVVFPGIVRYPSEAICPTLRIKVVVVGCPAKQAVQTAGNSHNEQPQRTEDVGLPDMAELMVVDGLPPDILDIDKDVSP